MNDRTTLASVRLITDDVDRLTAFYERLTGVTADRPSPLFAEVRTERGTLAIGSIRTVPLFGPGSAEPAHNRTAIVEFRVDDVDGLFARLDDTVEVVTPPTTMPWGNRSLLVRDPDGTLVNCFSPGSPEARARFA
ncbi:VOC family protein [Isoptericola hypogeus]|uniref:VOC family protein n=1 Tax=Isoptericola hypogeus TaxID=300179 RepID=A0ABN2J8N3_9MICO